VFSRRMVRKARQSEVNRLNGIRGGNPALTRKSVNRPDNPSDNPSDNRPDDKSVNPPVNGGSDKPHIPVPVPDPDKSSGSEDQNPQTAPTEPALGQVKLEIGTPPPPKPEKPDAPTTEFLKWFDENYPKHRNGARYFVKWDKDAPIVKKLLIVHSVRRLKWLSVGMWKTDDPWIAGTDRGIGVLSTKVSWLDDKVSEYEAKHGPFTGNPEDRY
jgi:hypothetical protein